jgi:hypothetical protein
MLFIMKNSNKTKINQSINFNRDKHSKMDCISSNSYFLFLLPPLGKFHKEDAYFNCICLFSSFKKNICFREIVKTTFQHQKN